MGMNSIFTMIKAVSAAIISAALLLFVFSGIAYYSADPAESLAVFGKIIYFSGASVCGVICGMKRQSEENRIVPTVVSSTVYIFILWAISMLVGSDESSPGIIYRTLFYLGGILTSVAVTSVMSRAGEKSKNKVSPGKLKKNTLKKISHGKI